MKLRLLAFLAAVLAVMLVSGHALAEKRIALVIGNSAYKYTPPLPNPKNDANDIAAALKRVGFDVDLRIDLTKADTDKALRRFGDRLEGAKAAVFYYAGHGIQVDGINYVVPIDAKLEKERDLNYEVVSLGTVLKEMEVARRVNLVFMDACRDNPLSRSLARSMGAIGRSAAVGRGLAPVEAATGTMISYATKDNALAADGDGRNSPYTKGLLKHIETPGLEVGLMLRRMRQTVMEETGDVQVPWDYGSLLGEFYFKGGSATAVAPVQPSPQQQVAPQQQADIVAWQSIQNSTNPKEIEAFILAFRNSPFAGMARARLEALKEKQVAALPTRKSSIEPSDELPISGKLRMEDIKGQPTPGDIICDFLGTKFWTKRESCQSYGVNNAIDPEAVGLKRPGSSGSYVAVVPPPKPSSATDPSITVRDVARLAREAAVKARTNPGNGFKVLTWASGERYEGETRDGMSNGRGVRTWSNGNRYEGDERDGKKHGRGVFTWANGERYEGEWRNDKTNGRGVRTWPNGNRYEGEERDGNKHGRGVFTFASGERYEGDWRNDKTNGRGVRTWSNGNRYEGEERDGKKHGRGVFTFGTGRNKGDRYEGEFRDDKENGHGVYIGNDGRRFEGEYRDGMKNGRGVYVYANGRIQRGTWKDGKFVGP